MSYQRAAGELEPGDILLMSSGCKGPVVGVEWVRHERVAVVYVCEQCGRRHITERGPRERLRVVGQEEQAA